MDQQQSNNEQQQSQSAQHSVADDDLLANLPAGRPVKKQAANSQVNTGDSQVHNNVPTGTSQNGQVPQSTQKSTGVGQVGKAEAKPANNQSSQGSSRQNQSQQDQQVDVNLLNQIVKQELAGRSGGDEGSSELEQASQDNEKTSEQKMQNQDPLRALLNIAKKNTGQGEGTDKDTEALLGREMIITGKKIPYHKMIAIVQSLLEQGEDPISVVQVMLYLDMNVENGEINKRFFDELTKGVQE